MEKVKISYETYNRLRELAHNAVDQAIREIFTYGSSTENIVSHIVNTAGEFKYLTQYGDLQGYKYRDYNGIGTYIPEFDYDYSYPCTVYRNLKEKIWWVDIHNMSKEHPAYLSLANKIFSTTRLIGA